jgi:hypothetical protein
VKRSEMIQEFDSRYDKIYSSTCSYDLEKRDPGSLFSTPSWKQLKALRPQLLRSSEPYPTIPFLDFVFRNIMKLS